MLTRYSFAISTATFMTLALFYVMETLITIQPMTVDEREPRHPVDFLPIPVRQTPPPPPPAEFKKEELTKTTLPPTRVSTRSSNEKVVIGRPEFGVPGGPDIEPTMHDFSDGALVNTMRARPFYPPKALRDGKEGYAIVQFDVTADGQVVNVAIVESSDRVFHKASVEAALRFRYKPRVVDGIAVATQGIRNRFRFEMNSE